MPSDTVSSSVKNEQRWMTLLACCALILAGVSGYFVTNSLVRHKESTEIHRHVNALADDLDGRIFQQALNSVERLSQHPEVIAAVQEPFCLDSLNLHVLLDDTRFLLEASIVYLINQDGDVVACTPLEDGGTLTGRNYSFRPYFQDAMKSKGAAIYAALGNKTLRRGIYYSYPILLKGQFKGVAVIKKRVEDIDAILKAHHEPCALLSPDGVVFASNRLGWLYRAAFPLDTKTHQRLLESQQFADSSLEPLGLNFAADTLRFGDELRAPCFSETLLPGWHIVGLYSAPQGNVLIASSGGFLLSFLAGLFLIIWKGRRDKKRTTASLYAREEQFRRLFSDSPDAIVILDLVNNRFVDVNGQAVERWGYSRSELLVMKPFMLIASDEEASTIEEIRKLKSNRSHIFETVLVHKEGTRIPAEACCNTIEILGEPCVYIIIRDLTQRKQFEQYLRISEARLKSVIESTNTGTWDWGVNTGEMLVNSRWAEILGHTKQALNPISIHTWERLCHPGDLPSVEQALAEHFSGTSDYYDMEFRMKHASGDWVWVHSRGRVIEWSQDGKPVRMTGTHTDITERKSNEIYLRETVARMKAIFENSLVGIMSLADRVITDVNPRMAEMLGYTPEEMIGQSPLKFHLCERNFYEFGEKYYWRLAEQELVQIEYPLLHKDGSSVWCMFSGKAIQPPDLSKGAIWIIQDISARKEQEQKLQETNAMLQKQTEIAQEMVAQANAASVAKSEFLANMSHEIRTPMTAILGFAEEALDGCTMECPHGFGERREFLETILRNGEYLLGLINDILDLSKIEAGKLHSETIVCSPSKIVEEVESLIRVRSGEKGVGLIVEYETPVPETIHSDPTRIRQILINLLGNAVKFTEHGSVRLCIRYHDDETGHQLLFDVHDTGLGMSEEQASRLFQPFSQADASMTRKYGGSGLGLAISKRLAKILGGDVALVSTDPGKGSCFRLSIAVGSMKDVKFVEQPGESLSESTVRQKPLATATKTLQNCRILLAEDGHDNQFLIRRILEKAGADVVVFENGKLAVEAVMEAEQQRQPFDVIVMDMQMPVMDGYVATRTLRAAGYKKPIIALTAHAMSNDRQKCVDAGCTDYGTKPVNRQQLIETIGKYYQPHSEVVHT